MYSLTNQLRQHLLQESSQKLTTLILRNQTLFSDWSTLVLQCFEKLWNTEKIENEKNRDTQIKTVSKARNN